MIVTYDRPMEIRSVISALLDHLKYKGALRWHLADDGSAQGYLDSLQWYFSEVQFTMSVTQRKGWGVNVNTALKARLEDYVFLCEDDYVASGDLDLNAGVALLESVSGIGLVRYDGLSGHALDLQLREADSRIGRINYLLIEHSSPFPYIYSNRPQLKHRRFHAHYGWYPEGRPLAETEETFVVHVKGDPNGPKLAALADGVPRAFDHIGRSWKGSAFDV